MFKKINKKIHIPKLATGGIIKDIDAPQEVVDAMVGIFMTQQEMIQKINHQKKIIDRLSRKIQNKNKKYRELKLRKMPPTLFGNQVIIVPYSMANQIMAVDKKFFDVGGIK